jgi:small subunit ribosomal protein S18b
VQVETECLVEAIYSADELKASGGGGGADTCCPMTEDWPSYVKLSNGKVFGVDFIVAATGVDPVIPKIIKSGLQLNLSKEDGGIIVDERLMSNIEGIFAAGDACSPGWQPVAKHWFQMRLWSQARVMGGYVARSMLAALRGEEKPLLEFAFEIFAHATQFFGYKVVFLGLFNGQKLGNDYEILLRVTRGEKERKKMNE